MGARRFDMRGVGDGRNAEAKLILEKEKGIDEVEHKTQDDYLLVTLSEGVQDGSFIAEALLKAGFRLKMLKEEAVNLEDVFMGITKGITN